MALCVGSLGSISRENDLPSWSELSGVYQYNPASYTVQATLQPGMEIRLNIVEPGGDIAPCIYRKPGSKGPYPCVLLLHGFTANKDQMMRAFGMDLTQAGMAVLSIDAPYHGSRSTFESKQLMQDIVNSIKQTPSSGGIFDSWRRSDTDGRYIATLFDIYRRGILDYRAALDWIQTRPEIDKSRIYVLGSSMGANMGTILAGIDSRVKGVALCVGGDGTYSTLPNLRPEEQLLVGATTPSLFVRHMAGRPIVMLNGSKDKVIPQSAAEFLFNFASQPKQQVWLNCGHQYNAALKSKALRWIIDTSKSQQDPQPQPSTINR